MKTVLIFCGLAILIAAGPVPGLAAESINMDLALNIDHQGDGSMVVTFRLTAKQWVIWREQYGDHPDILWRDMKQSFARYALDKFDLKKDDLQRTATVTFLGRAFATPRTETTSSIDIPKNFRLVSNTPREWIFNFVSQKSSFAPILDQTNHIFLPADAINARFESGGSGTGYLVYDVAPPSGLHQFLLPIGFVLLILGSALCLLSLLPGFRKPDHLGGVQAA